MIDPRPAWDGGAGPVRGTGLSSRREVAINGLSRRELIRRGLAAGIAVWLIEVTAGTVGFLWPNLKGGFGSLVAVGDFGVAVANPSTIGDGGTILDGLPAMHAPRVQAEFLPPELLVRVPMPRLAL